MILRIISELLGVAEEEAATLVEMGQSEGLSIPQIIDLWRTEPKPMTFGQMVAAERRFISDHKWSERQGKWLERRRKTA